MASKTVDVEMSEPLSEVQSKCITLVESSQGLTINIKATNTDPKFDNLISFLSHLSKAVTGVSSPTSTAISEAIHRLTLSTDFGGYAYPTERPLTKEQEKFVVFTLTCYLEAAASSQRADEAPKPIHHRPSGRRPMTMTEKIFAAHDIGRKGFVKPGDVIQVDIDWILASELSWGGMAGMYDSLKRPGIFRNDRFWLAGDHRVEPPLYNVPAVKKLMDASNRAHKEFNLTEFQGFNYTIMHTEFVRSRAQPGQLIVGADSHSCSAGAVSCLSIGMGAADVLMPLITGQTWFSVPETVKIELTGRPPKGIGGKDTILSILGHFKKNTIATDRVVEFTGPSIRFLSCDARFAISNMCTEFGAVTGIFSSDERTAEFVEKRPQKKYKNESIYFQPDDGAQYAESYVFDLSKVESFVAVYPSPDNVVPVSEVAGKQLDGTFIGACTTAEEDLIIAAMVLECGLKKGLKPVEKGRRKVVPGSRPIRHKLEKLGLIEVYQQAAFDVGVPGCSMCVGQGTDQAGDGEVWLSSQNRNFKNRMGPGSIANLASAATVAASSFDMTITDPRDLLDELDYDRLESYLGYSAFEDRQTARDTTNNITYSEPFGLDAVNTSPSAADEAFNASPASPTSISAPQTTQSSSSSAINGRALLLGDFIDTDAIIPSDALAHCTTDAEWGDHCMKYFQPDFRSTVASGHNIIVAGRAFGVGSSRDVAVNALKGCGVKCVIARGFAWIFRRNLANKGLLGVVVENEAFYERVKEGTELEVDVDKNEVRVGGERYPFVVSDIEKTLIDIGGIVKGFERWGKGIWDEITSDGGKKDEVKPGAKKVVDIEAIKA